MSFHRAKYVPRGGPDGGSGGDGGDLIFEATSGRNTLVDYRMNKRYAADNGRPGQGTNCFGARGEDTLLPVPVGTMIYDEETGELLADLDEEGARYVMIGGKGGAGNVAFKTATNRTPRYAQPGLPGEERMLRLELKLIADVGLLGYPNAGKSTFIGAVTASRSEPGAHPFTTLTPHLGVVSIRGGRSFVFADMPGLVEGASEGIGLGLEFLKHVERCALYLHLLAPEEWDDTVEERWDKLNHELVAYDEDLLERPQILVLTKSDLLDDDERASLVARLEAVSGAPVFVVSSHTGDGIPELIAATWRSLVTLRGEIE